MSGQNRLFILLVCFYFDFRFTIKIIKNFIIMSAIKYTSYLFMILSFLFSGIVLAENDEDEEDMPESEKEKIDLLQVRELGVKSYSISSALNYISQEEESQSVVSAWFNGETISIEVNDFYGKVFVTIEGVCNDVFIARGGGIFDIELDDLLTGAYSVEIKAGSNMFIGVLNVE